MENKPLSACYYPTTVVLVDDDPRFLKAMSLKLGQKLAYKLFDHPGKALKFLNEEYQPSPFIDRCLLQLEEQTHDRRDFTIDIKAISDEIYNPHRFEQISVALVDYAMPHMDGLTLCSKINDKNIKKVLLTGEADEKIAIDAFNKGLINQYIRKDSPQLVDHVLHVIEELQKEYFLDFSPLIIAGLTKDPNNIPTACLEDPVYFGLLQDIIQENKIVEYYLIDASGSYLLLDVKGSPSILAVKSEAEMQGYTEMAEDGQAPDSLIKAYADRSQIPHFFTHEDYLVDYKDWGTCSYSAQKLQGKEVYYYSLVNKPTRYADLWCNIVSYKDYLAKLD